MQNIILVAGATGNLGGRIIKALIARGATVRAVVRSSSDPEKTKHLKQLGIEVHQVDMLDLAAMTKVCSGVSCVVSALSGLREVIIDTQKVLLDAAIAAGVPRFIPSDFSLDFTDLPSGNNRNLDFRREFKEYLDKKPIAATTIFNGAFMDMLTNEMPMILFKQNKIFFWGNADQRMDFTTIANTAEFTANAALDLKTPRILRIAGEQISPRELGVLAGEIMGKKFSHFRPGGLGMFGVVIKLARFFAPGEKEIYPAWQGMQYMRDMLDGRAKMKEVDNNRYNDMQWTRVKDVISAHVAKGI
jgi:uncharacterized protein YbjT (DUF2867 family)